MEISFTGKRALVTGAGKGIGRAIALALAAGGAETVALSRTQQDLDSLKQECPSMQTLCVDLTDWDAARAVVEQAGEFDLLVNNAGVIVNEDFLEVTQENYDKIMDINLKACLNVSQVVTKKMVARGQGGSVVMVSSLASKIVTPQISVYNVSKAALNHLARCMALELGEHQIRVNTVDPTIVMTEMGKRAWQGNRATEAKKLIPMGKFAEPEDVVHPVLYLLSDKADMITGSSLFVDGGWGVH